MKNFSKLLLVIALGSMAFTTTAQEKQDWGDFKLWIDPGHSGRENVGMYSYSEAQKVLRVGLATRDFLYRFTTATDENIHMTRDDDQDNVSLEERSDMANAWGADFFYSIHSDAGSGANTTVTLFGGWKDNGEYVEKTPHGGKQYGEILCPDLTGVMYNTGTRGNYYDRVFYNGDVYNHTNHYPYLSVNRRTNMASLLSEGGFHTHPVQQALNMNDSYKHLEAFATFRSIMEYRGLERPDMVMLAGVVTNSENGQALDNVTVTCNGKTIVTDSYESLFSQYVHVKDLVHNGFFLYEDLTPGETYEVTYSCPGYTSASQTVTMRSNPQGRSGENVTWANISLTNEMPAVVSSNNVVNPNAVNKRNDIILIFSRKMDRTSVEQAFSINNNGQVTLSWDNDYTLRIKLGQLRDEMSYTITIDGSIAKNSQTNQYLDGDGDGVEGGNYTFSFMTLPTDNEAPYITSTSPEANTTMRYTLRPVIRVEYNEELDWNEDLAVDAIVVEDKNGHKYEGTLTHTVLRDASVLHYYLNQDLPRDMCFKVTVKGGFADMNGNVNPDDKTFKFLSEYRTVKDSNPVIGEYNSSEWFGPAGSGSSMGFTSSDDQSMSKSTFVHDPSIPSSYFIHYEFDPETSQAYWGLRVYCRKTDQSGPYLSANQSKDAVLQAYVYGDGADYLNTGFGIRTINDGVKRFSQHTMHRGWELVSWDIYNEECSNVSGSNTMVDASQWKFDSFWIWRGYVSDLEGELDDLYDIPWTGDIYFDDLRYVHYNDEEQTASLDDISDVNPGIQGDVTGDGEVDIADVNAIINVMLGKADETPVADVTGDGQVDIADVNAVINIMLGK